MFFNAHVFYSIRKSGGTNAKRIFGALLPDSAFTSTLKWPDLHDKATIEAFINHTRDKQLGLGILDHYELDVRSHGANDAEAGYAFSHQTPQLQKLVAKACGLESPERAKGLAHNFIESGVDINLLSHDPSVQDTMKKALRQTDVATTAGQLASFFKTGQVGTISGLSMFVDIILKYDLQNIDDWAGLWNEIALLLLHRQANKQATKDALHLAVKLTAKDYLAAIRP